MTHVLRTIAGHVCVGQGHDCVGQSLKKVVVWEPVNKPIPAPASMSDAIKADRAERGTQLEELRRKRMSKSTDRHEQVFERLKREARERAEAIR